MIAKREGRTTDTSQDYEYTNWDAVKKFVRAYFKLSHLSGRTKSIFC
jgi:menaquinone-dependent protoporphyrinogen oxidase